VAGEQEYMAHQRMRAAQPHSGRRDMRCWHMKREEKSQPGSIRRRRHPYGSYCLNPKHVIRCSWRPPASERPGAAKGPLASACCCFLLQYGAAAQQQRSGGARYNGGAAA